MEEKNYFQILNDVDVSDKVEKKNGLSYVAWANAWAEVKKRFPDTTYTIYENKDGWCYHTDGKTCWVKTGVTVNGIEHIEYLPVMDYKNKSIPANAVTSFDVNKAIQRSLTKAVARHGLGLYIYAGEDLPEEADNRANSSGNAPRTASKGQGNTNPPASNEQAEKARILTEMCNSVRAKGVEDATIKAIVAYKYNGKSSKSLTLAEAQDLVKNFDQYKDDYILYASIGAA